MKLELLRTRLIYLDETPGRRHSAFTDIVRWRGRYYLSFRTGESHVSLDGQVQIYVSDDAVEWRRQATLANESDLREAKFIPLEDKLAVNIYSRNVNRRIFTSQAHTTDGENWSAPRDIEIAEGYNLWRPRRCGDCWWDVGYRPAWPGFEDWRTKLFRTRDGLAWEKLGEVFYGQGANECALEFLDDGEAVAIQRLEAPGCNSLLGRARPPYERWDWSDLGQVFQGHMLQRWGAKLLALGRFYEGEGEARRPRTGVFTLEGGRLAHQLTLPSGGDTSYPGIVIEGHLARISYYSTRIDEASGELAPVAGDEPPPTAIYLAEVALR